MKSFLAIILLICLTNVAAYSQTYYVIHAKGSITNKTIGKSIKIGDKLSPEDELKFGSLEAAAVVMSRSQGRMLLNSKKTVKNAEGEFMAFVKNVLFPMNSNLKMSTRDIVVKTEIKDFNKYFGTEKFAVIGDILSIDVHEKYPISKKRRFIYRYKTQGGRIIQKKINYTRQTLKLNKNSLFKSKGDIINPEEIKNVDFYYFNANKKESQKLASFEPIFLDEQHLEKEINLLIKFIRDNKILKENELETDIFQYIYDVYGKTDLYTFHKWLENNTTLNNN